MTARDLFLRGLLIAHDLQVRQRVGSLGTVYSSPMDFLVREGTPAYPRAVPCDALGHPQMCYGNSIIAAVKQGFAYVEGYALRDAPAAPPVVIAHAWIADEAHAFEITWPIPGTAYLGVRFSVERADNCTWVGNGSVLQDRHRGYPLLQQRWAGERTDIPWPVSPWLSLARQGRWQEAFAWIQADSEDP